MNRDFGDSLFSFVKFHPALDERHDVVFPPHACKVEPGRVAVRREDAHRLQSAELLHQALVLLEVHDTVELHVVHLADKQPSFADMLLAADAVAYPAQVEEAVQQDKRQAEEDGYARNGKGHVLQASVDASGTAHGKGRQLVKDELHPVRSQHETFRLRYV